MAEPLVRLKNANEQKQSVLNEITFLSMQKEDLLDQVNAIDEEIETIRKQLITMGEGDQDG